MTETDQLARTNALLTEIEGDRKKAKDKEAAEAWTKPAAVSLVVIAVLAATAVQKSGSFGSRQMKHINQSIFFQVKASDEWAYFQAKSTKAHMFEVGAELLEHLGPNGEEEKRMVAAMEKKRHAYDKEKDDLKNAAEKLEKQRDDERRMADENAAVGAKLGNSVLGFQAAIAISSIGLVMKKKPLWFVSLATGGAATAWLFWCLFHGAPTQ